MEPLTETIDLDIDESNELAFKIKMEGAAATPAKVRLVCEGKDFSYMFSGYGTGEPEVVQFTLPQMSSKLTEGIYKARVEVLVDNRYFAPLQFDINFKKTLSVVAESIVVKSKPAQQDIKVSVAPITVTKPVQQQQIKFEQRPTTVTIEQHETKASKPQHSLRESYLSKANTTKDNSETIAARSFAKSLFADKQRK